MKLASAASMPGARVRTTYSSPTKGALALYDRLAHLVGMPRRDLLVQPRWRPGSAARTAPPASAPRACSADSNATTTLSVISFVCRSTATCTTCARAAAPSQLVGRLRARRLRGELDLGAADLLRVRDLDGVARFTYSPCPCSMSGPQSWHTSADEAAREGKLGGELVGHRGDGGDATERPVIAAPG